MPHDIDPGGKGEILEAIAVLSSETKQKFGTVFQTIRDLDTKIETRFNTIDGKFEQIDDKFHQIDGRFNEITTNFKGIESKFDRVDARFEGIESRFDRVDVKFEGIESKFDRVDARFEGIELKFEGIESKFDRVDARFDEVLEGITEFADQTERRFEQLEADNTLIKFEVTGVKSAISSIKNSFVTKGYLDDKLSDFREDLLTLIRRENGRLFSAL